MGGGAVTSRPATGALAVAGGVGTVLFAEGSAALSAPAEQVISAAAQSITSNHSATVVVTGYTDKVAGQPVNEKLSQQRADAVIAALRTAVGPGSTTYTAAAKGENDPVGSNDTAEGRQVNRRATITVS